MNKLSHLQPEDVFFYFEEISKIPRGSGNTKEISDYCVRFAENHKLEYYQDQLDNIIIKKPASPGYETIPTIILQGHLDMVCEKTIDSNHDFTKDSLDLYIEGDFVKARNTTLGGDDGIALAYGLALLAGADYSHPNLEILFTSDEETGMTGAMGLDYSKLSGKHLINLDSEEENTLLTSCAGGVTVEALISYPKAPRTAVSENGIFYEVELSGLYGGHSGTDINKERGNAIVLQNRILRQVFHKHPFQLIFLESGFKDNVIPSKGRGLLYFENVTDASLLDTYFQEIIKEISLELSQTEPGIKISLSTPKKEPLFGNWISEEDTKAVLDYLFLIPYGVQSIYTDIPGLVKTSLNPGILKFENGTLCLHCSIRSSVLSEKENILEKITTLTELFQGKTKILGSYPGWEYKKDSKLRELLIDTYETMYGKKPFILGIHAGLECGIFYENMKGLDCISIGPDIFDIHTTEERMEIPSVKRVWEYLVQVLKNTKDFI